MIFSPQKIIHVIEIFKFITQKEKLSALQFLTLPCICFLFFSSKFYFIFCHLPET